jgi:hypothetical protein
MYPYRTTLQCFFVDMEVSIAGQVGGKGATCMVASIQFLGAQNDSPALELNMNSEDQLLPLPDFRRGQFSRAKPSARLAAMTIGIVAYDFHVQQTDHCFIADECHFQVQWRYNLNAMVDRL